MKILVGCKIVPEDQDIVVNKDGSLDMSKAMPKISQFDLNAIEAAAELKANNADITVIALSIGGKYLDNAKVRKDLLSRGPDELNIVMDEKYENLLPEQTAKIMANTAQSIGFDLILCGDGSGDLYAQQTGVRLGALLNISTVSGVSKIISLDGSKIVIERALENEIEVLEVSLPAVISVSADINTPSIPGMKSIMLAGKKPINVMTDGAEYMGIVDVASVKAPQKKDRKHLIIEGDSDDKISEFVSHIRTISNL